MRLGKPPASSRNQLSLATPDMVAKLNGEMLKALCHCCMYPTSKATKKWPNKGKVGAADETLISLAHGLLGAHLVLKASTPVPARLAAAAAPTRVEPLVVTAGAGQAAVSGVLPSVLLRDTTWVSSVFLNLLGCSDSFMNETPTSADCERADLLLQLLRPRLETHKAARVADELKRASWVFEWVERNMGAVAAAAVAFGHVKEDLEIASSNDALLAYRESQFVFVAGDMALGEGCYLHWDKNLGRWVRSGKVVGEKRGYGCRDKEHARCSLLLNPSDLSSLFYSSYPAKSTEVVMGAARRGYFGALEQYVALGFLRTNTEAAGELRVADPAKGLLLWPVGALERVAAINFPGSLTLAEKQLHMVGYLFELVYDLMISPRDNVSRSPGFETPLGIFGGS